MQTLKEGMRVNDVLILKTLLNSKTGSTLDTKNNNFGTSTSTVVKAFQRSKGLLPDGVVGPLTWEKLQEVEAVVSYPSEYISKVVALLKTQVGVKEKTGKNDGEDVKKYLNAVGLPEGYAWCQAFLFWGFSVTATALSVVNPMPKTAGVLDCWNKSLKYQVDRNSFPKAGDVFTMNFGKGQGHTGIVIRVEDDYIITVEGNTSADPTVPTEDRDGQGVFIRRRKISTINNGFIRYYV